MIRVPNRSGPAITWDILLYFRYGHAAKIRFPAVGDNGRNRTRPRRSGKVTEYGFAGPHLLPDLDLQLHL